ncbi:hypothetical protein [Streptomyces sp. AK02-01A]|uniref:hypothetical protein n=1 Tax=Streptomyces sp. AK02-01A TaxID=3028648 RepID=UPI0029B4BD44|nr:hypothetical protein [Streptomyces sp. AK02-01A]MDX3851118.1 hypothetical protein [Streptomyces sp. AK02-01A]
MGEFLSAAMGFPAVLFGAALLVVVAFWVLVLAGAVDHDPFHTPVDTEATGLGGVPVTVPVSLLVAVAWFAGLAGSVLVRRSGVSGDARTLLLVAVLVAALLIAWGVTRLLVRRLRALVPEQAPPSRLDFVGLTCTIRTGSVSSDFGQAEVAADDGSTAIVQVRQIGDDILAAGSTGLLYAYDHEGEFFWVAPYDPALDPRTAG